MTPTETVPWEELRDRRLGGLKFRRQHAIRRFVVDFYCHELGLAVEVDGGIHDEPDQHARDVERQALLEELGVRFLRFSNQDIEDRLPAVLATIREYATINSPSPAKSGEGGGG